MFIGTNKIKYISRQDALDELSKLDLCDVEIKDQEEKIFLAIEQFEDDESEHIDFCLVIEIPVSLALNKSYTICASDNYEEILEKYNKIKGEELC